MVTKKAVQFMMLAIVAIALLSGCVTTNTTSLVESPYGQLAVRYAVLRFLADDQAKVDAALKMVKQVRTYVSAAKDPSVTAIEGKVVGWIVWGDMHPADRDLLESLIGLIVDDLKEKVGARVLDEEGVIKVLTYIDWIESAICKAKT